MKIGFSIDLPQRFDQLGVMMPGLRLVGHVPGTRRTEGRLHRKFAAYRERGEWFRNATEIRDFLRAEATALNLTMPPCRQRTPKAKEPVFVDTAEIGRKGGKARAAGMTKAERSESARNAVNARWAKAGKKPAAAKKKAAKG